MSSCVVLNSGGFDSIVLLNYLKTIQRAEGIHSLHFLYGANNEKEQLRCVNKACKKLEVVNKVIRLPKIDWTASNFFTDKEYTKQGQYLEYRNLIFLSYALSYAESIKADTIYLALINNGSDYPDCSDHFIRSLNSFCEPASGIVIDTPFIFDSKMRLAHIAKYLHIKDSDYFSCDKPIDGKSCGVCLDCQAIKELKEEIVF